MIVEEWNYDDKGLCRGIKFQFWEDIWLIEIKVIRVNHANH